MCVRKYLVTAVPAFNACCMLFSSDCYAQNPRQHPRYADLLYLSYLINYILGYKDIYIYNIYIYTHIYCKSVNVIWLFSAQDQFAAFCQGCSWQRCPSAKWFQQPRTCIKEGCWPRLAGIPGGFRSSVGPSMLQWYGATAKHQAKSCDPENPSSRTSTSNVLFASAALV